MAHKTGTAQNLEDLFGQMVSFLTTDNTLKEKGQAWQVLRMHRDNLAEMTSDMPGVRPQTCRYDARSLNTDDISGGYGYFYSSAATMGTSFVRFKLREAKAVKTVRLRASTRSGYAQYMLRDFRLQYSDDNTSWITALTVTSAEPFLYGDWRDYSIPGNPGAHLYWRIVLDSAYGASVAWASMLLLDEAGEVANHFGSEVILKGVGNAGTDAIYVGIRSEYDAAAGWYNLFLNGYAGFDPNERSWFEQPGALPGHGVSYTAATPMVPCWDAPMPYWFSASGRSFRFGIKVSTSYEGGYLGFILPYATPGQYPYPLAVGGSLVPTNNYRSSEWRYSYVSAMHGTYPGPGGSGTPSGSGIWTTLYLRHADGNWNYLGNRYMSSGTEVLYSPENGAWRSVWPHCINSRQGYGRRAYRECLGGGYLLQPCILVQSNPAPVVLGELEGTYIVSGYENAAENTLAFDGKTHVVLQNAYRSTVHEFWALSLD